MKSVMGQGVGQALQEAEMVLPTLSLWQVAHVSPR